MLINWTFAAVTRLSDDIYTYTVGVRGLRNSQLLTASFAPLVKRLTRIPDRRMAACITQEQFKRSDAFAQ